MDFDTFVCIVNKMPKDVAVQFFGVSDPWLNPRIIDMIEYADRSGHPVVIGTTLEYTPIQDIERIKDIPFMTVNIHVSTNYNENISVTDEYLYKLELCNKYFQGSEDKVKLHCTCVGSVDRVHPKVAPIIKRWKKHVPDLLNRANNVDPSIVPLTDKKKGPIKCQHDADGIPFVFPNGNLYLCCMDYGLKHIIGNLIEQSYDEVNESPVRKELNRASQQEDSDMLCRSCVFALPYER